MDSSFSVGIRLQALQLNQARDVLAQARVEQPPALLQPGQAPQPVPDVILDLSAAAQQLIG
jgi:hypothetical protein